MSYAWSMFGLMIQGLLAWIHIALQWILCVLKPFLILALEKINSFTTNIINLPEISPAVLTAYPQRSWASFNYTYFPKSFQVSLCIKIPNCFESFSLKMVMTMKLVVQQLDLRLGVNRYLRGNLGFQTFNVCCSRNIFKCQFGSCSSFFAAPLRT